MKPLFKQILNRAKIELELLAAVPNIDDHLITLGVTGNKRDCFACPLANYVINRLNQYPEFVGNYSVDMNNLSVCIGTNTWDDCTFLSLPTRLRNFIVDVDNGEVNPLLYNTSNV